MQTIDWIRSVSQKKETIEEYDGKKYKKTTYEFIGKLPYHMMMDARRGVSTQSCSGSMENGDYYEESETLHFIGDRDHKAVYLKSIFEQVA